MLRAQIVQCFVVFSVENLFYRDVGLALTNIPFYLSTVDSANLANPTEASLSSHSIRAVQCHEFCEQGAVHCV